MLLSKIYENQQRLAATLTKAKALVTTPAKGADAKTIGIKVPESLRAAILQVQKDHELPTYTQAVLFCLFVGVERLTGE